MTTANGSVRTMSRLPMGPTNSIHVLMRMQQLQRFASAGLVAVLMPQTQTSRTLFSYSIWKQYLEDKPEWPVKWAITWRIAEVTTLSETHTHTHKRNTIFSNAFHCINDQYVKQVNEWEWEHTGHRPYNFMLLRNYCPFFVFVFFFAARKVMSVSILWNWYK